MGVENESEEGAADPYLSPAKGEVAEGNEEEKLPWGPWWSLLWGGVVLCIWVVAQTLFFGVFAAAESIKGEGHGLQDTAARLTKDGDLMGPLAFAAAVVGCIAVIMVVRAKGVTLATGMALCAPKWWVWLVLPFAMLALMAILNLAVMPFQGENALEDKAGIVGMIRETDFLILLLLGVAVGAPFFEEFLFRGLLHEGLKQSFLGVWGSAIVTALVFSLIHRQYQDLSAFLFLFLLGVAFVAARELTGSLWVPIAMHAIQNALATIPMFLVLNGYIPDEQIPKEFHELIEAAEKLEESPKKEEPAADETAMGSALEPEVKGDVRGGGFLALLP